ncbi:MAG TPA: hypothetical protein VGW57_05100 [Chthoniobacterales bacterium]|nr:hypothetical protein [Chthoniobacterales bacterium]
MRGSNPAAAFWRECVLNAMRIGSPAPALSVIQKWSMLAGTRSISAAKAITLPAT